MNVSIHPPKNALLLMERLESAGFEAYAVGGCVRDALLGRVPHDWDITTNAHPEQMKAFFADLRTLDMGLKHGTVSVVLDDLYEITTYRVDGTYTDGRHPDSVTFSARLEDDLSRRDFTINAMAYSPKRGLVDAFDGVRDLEDGIIRCVGDAECRMEEDALRILRAVRFQSRLGFAIDEATRRAILSHIPHLAAVSAERIGSEFRQLLAAPHVVRAISENGELCAAVVPPYRRALTDTQVKMRTLDALSRAGEADETTRFALLFHALCDADAARACLKALKYSTELIESVGELVALHDVPLPADRPSAKRLMASLSPAQLDRLLMLKRCLNGTDAADAFSSLRDTLIAEHAALSLKDLAVDGRTLIAMGIKPGKELGLMLQALLDDVLDERIPNEKEALMERVKAHQP